MFYCYYYIVVVLAHICSEAPEAGRAAGGPRVREEGRSIRLCIYIYICMYTEMCIYIYIYRERERERERGREIDIDIDIDMCVHTYTCR